jgi:hypothetical protein
MTTKGRNQLGTRRGKSRRRDKSAQESDPVPDSEEEPHKDEDGGGPPGAVVAKVGLWSRDR